MNRKKYQTSLSKIIRYLEHYHKTDNISVDYINKIKKITRRIPVISHYKYSIINCSSSENIDKKILIKYLKGLKIHVGMMIH